MTHEQAELVIKYLGTITILLAFALPSIVVMGWWALGSWLAS